MQKRAGFGCLGWGCGLLIGIPLLLFVGVAILFISRDRSASRQVAQRLAKLDADGMPIDDLSMKRFSRERTSPVDTQAWLNVFAELQSQSYKQSTQGVPSLDPVLEVEVPAPGEDWAVGEQATRSFLSQWSAVHDTAVQLALKQLQPGAKPVELIDVFQSIDTQLPNTQNMREAARMLWVRGKVAAYDGDGRQLKQSIEALQGCARTLYGEPILISQLVSMAIDSMAIDLLRRGVQGDIFSEAELTELLANTLSKTEISPQWRFALQGERGAVLPVFANPGLTDATTYRRLPGRSRDTLQYLDFMEEVLEVPDDDIERFQTEMNRLESKLSTKLNGGLLEKLDLLLTSIMTPSVGACGSAFARQAVQYRIASQALAVRLYQRRTGKLPQALSELDTFEFEGVALDRSKLKPPGNDRFGYRLSDTEAVLWGARLSQGFSIPSEPPPVGDGVAFEDENKIWIWKLNRTE